VSSNNDLQDRLTKLQEAATFNDWGKMKFAEFPGKSWKDILPRASEEARDLVANLVVFESKERLTAAKVGSCRTLINGTNANQF